jgi:pimeloyl-ACP methyl ester carboxylesterase
MDHLGIQKFFFMGYCIGGPFALKLMERAPDRVVAAVLCQPVGDRPENPDVMYKSGKDVWAPELLARRPDLNMAMVDKYLHDLYRVRPDFVYSVSRDFARSCQTPMLVMPDDTPAHPYQTSVDIASLAPNRGNGLPLARPPGAEGTDDQPSAHLPKGAPTRDSEPLSRGASARCQSWLSRRPHLVLRLRLEVVSVVRSCKLARGLVDHAPAFHGPAVKRNHSYRTP